MTTDLQARRTSGWEAMQRNLAADAVVAEAVLYASGGRLPGRRDRERPANVDHLDLPVHRRARPPARPRSPARRGPALTKF